MLIIIFWINNARKEIIKDLCYTDVKWSKYHKLNSGINSKRDTSNQPYDLVSSYVARPPSAFWNDMKNKSNQYIKSLDVLGDEGQIGGGGRGEGSYSIMV